MSQHRVKNRHPPHYVARDKAGVMHATNQYGQGQAYCGIQLYNFNKRISLEPAEWGNGFSYSPPPEAKVTCLECLGEEMRCAKELP